MTCRLTAALLAMLSFPSEPAICAELSRKTISVQQSELVCRAGSAHAQGISKSDVSAPAKIMVLIQDSIILGNKMSVEIAPSWIRITNNAQGYFILSKAPKWDVYLCSPKTRKVRYISYKQLMDSDAAPVGIVGSLGSSLEFANQVKKNEYKFGTDTFCDTRFAGCKYQPHYYCEKLNTIRYEIKSSHVITVCKPVPRQALAILCKAHSLPPLDGIPLAVYGKRTNGEKIAQLSTVQVGTRSVVEPKMSDLACFERTRETNDIVFQGHATEIVSELLTF